MKYKQDLCTSLFALCLLLFVALACGGGSDRSDQAASNAPATTNSGDKKTTEGKSDSPASSGAGIRVEKIDLAKDDGKGDAGDVVSSFQSTDNPLHFVAHLSEFESGTKIKMVLTAIDAGGSKNEKVGELEKTTTAFENVLDAHWEFPKAWPVGRYKIEAFVNEKLDKSLEFDIR
jgi:hypothetical protein